jgi:hypothetical protein
MQNLSNHFSHPGRLRWAALFSLVAVLAVLPLGANAVDLNLVTRVEEDWELVVAEPGADNAAPQVSCLISPVSNVDGVYATLELNHGSLPEYSPGGLQLQVWSGEDWLTVRDRADSTLHHSNETVTWTQKMWIGAGKVNFKVDNGASDSWGSFGVTDNIKLSISTSLTNLAGYSPDFSASQSGIGYGSQRVQSLVLKKVRYYNAQGNLLLEDTTPRVVHQQ